MICTPTMSLALCSSVGVGTDGSLTGLFFFFFHCDLGLVLETRRRRFSHCAHRGGLPLLCRRVGPELHFWFCGLSILLTCGAAQVGRRIWSVGCTPGNVFPVNQTF